MPTELNNVKGPLSGLRVLDFTRVLAGPFATALLADVGAEVIKVEPPHGDDYRHIGPFIDGESALFMSTNRGKRSIVLDLKSPEDLKVALRLAETADVVVENFRPGVADKLGIGYSTLSAVNPKLVYLSISGFGQTGPMRDRPAYDIIIQATSGLMSLTGDPDGPPVMVGEAIADLVAGLYGSWAVTSALWQREQTGRGCYIDLAMFDALLSLLPTGACRHLASGEIPQRVGNRHPLSAPFGVYQTSDGHVAIAVLNERLFERFAEVIKRPDLVTDPRFRTDADRAANEPFLRSVIEQWSTPLSSAEVESWLSKAGIPVAPIQNLAEAIHSEQTRHRMLFRQDEMSFPLPEQPAHFSGTVRGRPAPVPKLGQHTQQILADLW
ncbi:CaiB/BaiF CoA transferase family protein [Microvirga arabica]|uniref:CaiB/BaiF CoA transferase family protein n=1 Tax=Microvirga arabica TaxID=1128671 RepID=UPI00193A6129|nr:CoA transferase [Microvirga arabica]MBM1175271.1 CoA transferase [Microvirga arabica]